MGAREEAALVAGGLPYLEEVWSDTDWRLFAVRDATPARRRHRRARRCGRDTAARRRAGAGPDPRRPLAVAGPGRRGGPTAVRGRRPRLPARGARDGGRRPVDRTGGPAGRAVPAGSALRAAVAGHTLLKRPRRRGTRRRRSAPTSGPRRHARARPVPAAARGAGRPGRGTSTAWQGARGCPGSRGTAVAGARDARPRASGGGGDRRARGRAGHAPAARFPAS